MGKSLGGFVWQLERKRKYYMSFGSSLLGGSVRMRSRTTSTVATTAVTFSLCLLLYINLWAPSSTAPKSGPSSFHGGASINVIPTDDSKELEEGKVKQKPIDFKGEAHLVNRNSFQNFKPSFPPESPPPSPGHNNNNNNNINLENSLVAEDNGGENESGIEKQTENHPANSNLERMRRIFMRADVNHDRSLSFPEISKWINDGVKQHFTQALKDNFDSFFSIDKNPRNGRVEWSEYLEFHMKKLGYKGPPEATPEAVRSKDIFKLFPKHIKVEIAALEARWSETASNDPEFLTVDEFLAFTHPEASPTRLLATVQDTFNTFDLDGDGIISKVEFDTTYAEAEGVDNVYREDLHLIDTDGNQQISRVELMRYMDPKNTIHADKDAKKIIEQVDGDGDEKLSWDELSNKLQLLIPTKLFNVARNFHANMLHN